jgi:hypothetical protein
MHFLFRIIIGTSLVWLICNFFYSLGKKNALNEKKNESNSRRKKVESTVVEKENKTDKDF